MHEPAVVIALIGLIVTIIAGALGLWQRISSEIGRVDKNTRDQLQRGDEAMQEKLRVIDQRIQDLREMVIRDYATAIHMEKIEGKLTGAIERLTEEVKILSQHMIVARGEVAKRSAASKSAK